MNQELKRHQATRLGLIFARYGIKLTRATKLDHIAELYGDKNWSVKTASPQADDARKRQQALFTPLQKIVAQGYGHGDYSHYESMADVQPGDDLLFEFALQEALEAGEDIDEYAVMLRTAIRDLEDVLAHVEQLQMQGHLCNVSSIAGEGEPTRAGLTSREGNLSVRQMQVRQDSMAPPPVKPGSVPGRHR